MSEETWKNEYELEIDGIKVKVKWIVLGIEYDFKTKTNIISVEIKTIEGDRLPGGTGVEGG